MQIDNSRIATAPLDAPLAACRGRLRVAANRPNGRNKWHRVVTASNLRPRKAPCQS